MSDGRWVGVWSEEAASEVDLTCGYCGRAVSAARLGPSVFISARDSGPGGKRRFRIAAAYVCPRTECHHPSLVFREFSHDRQSGGFGHETVGQLPWGSADAEPDLPAEIESDRMEAWACLHGGCFRAAVIMARAAVQRAVRALEPEGGTLAAEIDSLVGKGKITTELMEWAHAVRMDGNDAAHPDTLGEVTRKDAADSLEFMDAFLRLAVALPARRRARAGQ